MQHLVPVGVAFLLLCTGCASGPAANPYGTFHRAISTRSSEAQQRFDEGMLLCYGFNHDAAVKAFEAALAADPDCAMAWWGIGYALGPNINLPLADAAVSKRAHEAAQKAWQMVTRTSAPVPSSPAERALIEALTVRYTDPAPADRAPLDRAYADAMRRARAAAPADADIGALFAESLLDLSPWNQWEKDGKPREGTLEVVSTLQQVLAAAPTHVGAIHFYIHTTEGSPNPERALPYLDQLPRLAPGCGHLVHMPAHTRMRCGNYEGALASNLAAVDVDHAFFAKHGPQGIYHGYLAHNQHFACYAAMFLGDSATSMRMARDLVAELPAAMKDGAPEMVDGFLPMPLHVMVRFGQWDAILREPIAGEKYPIARTLWHYARGVALANTGKFDEARREQAEFERLAAAVKPDATVGLTPAQDVFAVVRGMLAGEIGFRSGDRTAGLASLRQAVIAEDALRYDEPPGWMQPVRHALGALLLENGEVAAALVVYQEDLEQHHDNGWSLKGLAECQRRLGDPAAAATEAAFAKAWAKADIPLQASCFCRQ